MNPAELNDLWKYNISSNTWTWMHGSHTANQTGNLFVLFGREWAIYLQNTTFFFLSFLERNSLHLLKINKEPMVNEGMEQQAPLLVLEVEPVHGPMPMATFGSLVVDTVLILLLQEVHFSFFSLKQNYNETENKQDS
jgi:hypothetical protein